MERHVPARERGSHRIDDSILGLQGIDLVFERSEPQWTPRGHRLRSIRSDCRFRSRPQTQLSPRSILYVSPVTTTLRPDRPRRLVAAQLRDHLEPEFKHQVVPLWISHFPTKLIAISLFKRSDVQPG